MMRLFQRLYCRLFGHRSPEAHWGAWRPTRLGRIRLISDRCGRCDAVLGIRQERERAG